MKLRMYLRGLGIGVVVTALIMGFSTEKENKISDSEVIKRAEALGMVTKDNTLKSIVAEPIEEPKEEIKEEIKEEPKKEPIEEPKEEIKEEPKEEIKEEPTKESEEAAIEDKTVEASAEKQVEEPKIETDESTVITSGNFTLEIAGGSGSEKVSALLEKGGVIDSANQFDAYLCSNGYDHRITAGTHIIPAGSDYETIAKIITSK